MLKVLSDSLSEDVSTHFKKRLVGYAQGNSDVVTLSFSDGTTAEADMLVGADGVGSVTREVMYQNLADAAMGHDEVEARKLESYIRPTWTGMYAYRALIDAEKLLEIAPGHQTMSKPMLVSNQFINGARKIPYNFKLSTLGRTSTLSLIPSLTAGL